MWRGTISFGMVAIPIRMYVANESKSVSFRLLCPNDLTPIKNRRFCETEQRMVEWGEVIRGFEVAKDEYVPITDEDLASVPIPTSQSINILEFVPDQEIEAGVYLKSAYYLEPEESGAKAYTLLKAALDQTQKVAIGKVTFREGGREQLCRLALHEKGLLLNTLHWPDEIRDAGELKLPDADAEVHERELQMAVMLIENLSATFDPGRYSDQYREALLEVVQAKQESRPMPQAPAALAKITDLMEALKASVEQSKQGEESKTAAGHRKVS
jgi:DNA end-binding protein Ku